MTARWLPVRVLLGARMGRGIWQKVASGGSRCQRLSLASFAFDQLRATFGLVMGGAPSRIRTCAHGSGGRFWDLANSARCLLGLDHSSSGWPSSFRAYSGSWILAP